MTAKDLLGVLGLSKRFGGLVALDGIDLSVAAGELVGVIGPNGSGKTTLFNVISGILRPDGGEVRFEGRSLAGLAPHRVTRLGIARTFQNIRLFREMTVLENVCVACHPHVGYGAFSAVARTDFFDRHERALREEAEGLLEIFGLWNRRGERAAGLPYGEQRKLEIARALAARPKLLLLDEPAAGMNPAEVERLIEFIRSIRQRFGLTIVLIEHQMRLVMGLCERVVVMDFGKVIASGEPAKIRNDPRVLEAYLGKGAKW